MNTFVIESVNTAPLRLFQPNEQVSDGGGHKTLESANGAARRHSLHWLVGM